MVITLDITNNAHNPETFAPAGTQQTILVGRGSSVYGEDPQAEYGPDRHSCAFTDSPIQPGAHLRCDVVYDIPVATVNRARSRGLGLIVVNFGVDVSPGSTQAPASVGLFIINPLGTA